MILKNQQWCRLAAVGLCALWCGCASTGGRRDLPEWVRDPAALEKSYPRRRYFIGMGVCGGASGADLMSRKQAEATAVADIAAVVEVQINDTVEAYDTSVERNGKLLEQNVRIQTTKRVVTGILSGVEIKHVYFDERSLNWHTVALLDRSKAGAGAAEAVAQRLARGRTVLDGLGAGPISDLIALRRLDRMTTELDRLAVALAIFAPSRKAAATTQIKTFKSAVAAQRETARAAARIRVVMRSDPAAPLPPALRAAAVRALEEVGLNVATDQAAGEFHVTVKTKTVTQVGAMRIFEVSSGATFKLIERGRTVMQGRVPIDPLSASRSNAEHLSRTRSLNRLADRLRMGIVAMLNNEGA